MPRNTWKARIEIDMKMPEHNSGYIEDTHAAGGAIDWKAAPAELDISIPDLDPRSRLHE